MAKHGRAVPVGTAARIAHTKQKPKPRLVTRAHLLEQGSDPLAYDDVRRLLQRAESARKRKA